MLLLAPTELRKYDVRATKNSQLHAQNPIYGEWPVIISPGPGLHVFASSPRGQQGARRGLRERAVVLVLVIVLIVAAVVVCAIRAVKPKRVKFRAGLRKITLVDFEADAGGPDDPGGAAPGDGSQKPPGRHHRR